MSEVSEELDVSGDFDTVNEELYRKGMTDGLPVVPPTRERVEEMLSGTDRNPDQVIGVIPPKYGNATTEKIAVNAVMAGCNPDYLPVLIAAVEAMTEEPFNVYGINATTHPAAPLLILNGPIVDELNVNYGYNVFGQGWRANATIGRAIRLLLINVGGGLRARWTERPTVIPASTRTASRRTSPNRPGTRFTYREGSTRTRAR